MSSASVFTSKRLLRCDFAVVHGSNYTAGMPPLPQRLRLFGIVLAMVASLTDADEVVVYDGFLGGEGFLAMSPAEQRAFAMGVIDGVLVSPLFDAPTPNSTTGLCVASAA